MTLPLEDQFNDVLGKAARGLGRSPAALAAAAGLSVERVEAVLGGNFDASAVRPLAEVLGLSPGRTVALGEGTYRPHAIEVDGLAQFNTPFDDMTVNAYLVWDVASREAAAFDTGSDAGEILDFARERDLRITQAFITHGHGDHVYDLDRLLEKTRAKAWAPERENVAGTEPFSAGRSFSIGALGVETRLTWGHSSGGVTYVVRGLTRPLAICGDALFAGSMGGGAVSYADALRTNRAEIFSLPPETVIAPGHGPLTTVAEERANNPFYPELS